MSQRSSAGGVALSARHCHFGREALWSAVVFYRFLRSNVTAPKAVEDYRTPKRFAAGGKNCKHGSALIVVLAMVVLLAALIVAFFSTARLSQQISASSANQTKADLFAQGAADCIVSEFRQTIAGGTLTVSGSEFPNLVTVSGSGAEVLTTSPSANGRKVSLARWNLPRLLPAAGVDDLTPPLADHQVPRWINVTRDGNADGQVFGRYAYMVYNEGGLLDANYAGSVTPSGTALTVWNRKGSTAFADLTRIGLTASDAAQLVGWRNYASVRAGGALPNFSVDWSRFANVAAGGLTLSGSLFNNQSDQRFTSRRQLINFFTKGVAQNDADRQRLQTALQYLGTFSAALNRPTHKPADGEPTVSAAFGLDADSATINVPFQELAVSGGFTRNDGSAAADGEPLVARRFPLSYTLWLTHQGPSASAMSEGGALFSEYVKRGMPRAEVERLRRMGTPENIRKYFGLRWDGAMWIYDPDQTGGSAADIKRLGGISGREPNFFELLKAALRAGSVAGTRVSLNQEYHSHLIQIGANIIDQSQPENFPTAIVFNRRAYWGTVDLPYLYALTYVAVLVEQGAASPPLTGNQPRAGATVSVPGKLALLDVPVLWNPHQNNTASPLNPELTPRRLRIGVSGRNVNDSKEAKVTMKPYCDNGAATLPVMNPLPPSVTYADGKVDAQRGFVEFQQDGNTSVLEFANPAAQDLYREPTPLLRSGKPNGSELKTGGGNTLSVSELGSGEKYLGFHSGEFASLFTVSGTVCAVNALQVFLDNQLTVTLEYQAADGQWRPYRQVTVERNSNDTYLGVPYDCADSDLVSGDPYRQSALKAWRGTAESVGYRKIGASPSLATVFRRYAITTFDPRLSWGLVEAKLGNGTSVGQWLDTSSADKMEEIETYFPSLSKSEAYLNVFYYGNMSTDARYSPGRAGQYGLNAQGYLTDADGVVRRPIGGFVSGNTIGAPLVKAKGTDAQNSNRPVMLQRPYRSVAELGYVFANRPWRHLSMMMPESGAGALLDVFSVSDRDGALAAGRVDLNTRQSPVLQAILSGAYRDELAPHSNTGDALTAGESAAIAGALLARAAREPLGNIADLVGRYHQGGSFGSVGGQPSPYDGFSADLPELYTGGKTAADRDKTRKVTRFMESAIRALSDSGQAGAWNLLIDVIAQTGRADGRNFSVEAERRYWLHVAIDKQTGKVIARQLEEVAE